MRTEKRTWEFIDNAALLIYYYNPINDNQAIIKGCGRVWNDRVQRGDTIVVKTSGGKKAELIVDEILFTNETFEATVTLGNIVQ
jgi:hypothetical protein